MLDEHGNVVGVISEMDRLQAILSGTYHGEAGGTVGAIMTREVESVEEGVNVLEVAQRPSTSPATLPRREGGQVRGAGLPVARSFAR